MTINPPSPRAKSYTDYFASLQLSRSPSKMHGFMAITSLLDVEAGDLMSWKTKDVNAKDTGHVMILGPPPPTNNNNNNNNMHDPPILQKINETAYYVSLMDASQIRHQADSRCNFELLGKCRYTGPGYGKVIIRVDGSSRPVAIQFHDSVDGSKSGGHYLYIRMARIL